MVSAHTWTMSAADARRSIPYIWSSKTPRTTLPSRTSGVGGGVSSAASSKARRMLTNASSAMAAIRSSLPAK